VNEGVKQPVTRSLAAWYLIANASTEASGFVPIEAFHSGSHEEPEDELEGAGHQQGDQAQCYMSGRRARLQERGPEVRLVVEFVVGR